MNSNQAAGSYCMYGRDPVVLCVKQPNNTNRHEPLEFLALKGFKLPCDPEERWHTDLSTLAEYYRIARGGVPFVLADDDHNEVHFNLPDPVTRTTSGAALGIEQPRYDERDLERLDRRTSIRLKKANLPLAADETDPVSMPGFRYRSPSLRTQESIDNFKPVLLREVEEGDVDALHVVEL